MLRKQKGFTLIELVMIIVIIGILAAVAIPRYIDLSTSASDASARGVLGSLRSANAVVFSSNLVGGTTASITMGQLTTGVQGVQLGAPATNSITAIIGSRTYTFTLTTVGYAPTTMFFMGDSVNASW